MRLQFSLSKEEVGANSEEIKAQVSGARGWVAQGKNRAWEPNS